MLSALLPLEMRDAVLGDLEEGYAIAPNPVSWYWKQAARSMGPAIRMRWRTPGLLRVGVAAVVGYIVVAIVVIATDAALSAIFHQPNRAYMLLSLAAAWIAGMTGGAVAAWFVPMNPRRASQVFAIVLAIMGAMSAIAEFNRVPLWYSLALLVAGPCAALFGGWLSESKVRPDSQDRSASA